MKTKTPQIKVVLTLAMLAAFTVVSRAVVTVDFGDMNPPTGNIITYFDPQNEGALSWLRTADLNRSVAQSFITPGDSNYLLSAITMKLHEGIDTSFTTPSGFTINFYQLTGPGQDPTNWSFLTTQSGVMQPTTAVAVTDSFFTFQLGIPIELTAGTSYGYTLAFQDEQSYNWLKPANSDGSPDPNGTRAWTNNNSGNGWQSTDSTYVYYMEGTAVPEPSTIALFGIAALLVVWRVRRTRQTLG